MRRAARRRPLAAAALRGRRGAGARRDVRGRAWRTRACSSPTSGLAPGAVADWKRARRRRRAHPRALVGDRAGPTSAQQARRASTPPTTTTRGTTGRARPRGRDRARRRDEGDAHDHRPRAAVGEHASRRKHNPRWKPTPTEYADFARAVATRYKAQVDRYLIWNEPNQPGWLQPQWEQARAAPARRSRRTSTARWCAPPQPAINAADPGAEVVIGELAPVGDQPDQRRHADARRCRSCARWAASTTSTSRSRPARCKGFKAAQARQLRLSPAPAAARARPAEPGPRRGPVRRPRAAVHGARQAARRASGCSVSRQHPPDRVRLPDLAARPGDRHLLALQTRYLQQAAYIAWASKRVRGLSFYQWDDEPVENRGAGTKRYAGWQTGLRFINGKPKPVLCPLPAPFVIDQARAARPALLWGQVRPDSTPRSTRRGAPARRDRLHATVAPHQPATATALWTRRLTLTARAAYRYRWTAEADRCASADPVERSVGDRRPPISARDSRSTSASLAALAP